MTNDRVSARQPPERIGSRPYTQRRAITEIAETAARVGRLLSLSMIPCHPARCKMHPLMIRFLRLFTLMEMVRTRGREAILKSVAQNVHQIGHWQIKRAHTTTERWGRSGSRHSTESVVGHSFLFRYVRFLRLFFRWIFKQKQFLEFPTQLLTHTSAHTGWGKQTDIESYSMFVHGARATSDMLVQDDGRDGDEDDKAYIIHTACDQSHQRKTKQK